MRIISILIGVLASYMIGVVIILSGHALLHVVGNLGAFLVLFGYTYFLALAYPISNYFIDVIEDKIYEIRGEKC